MHRTAVLSHSSLASHLTTLVMPPTALSSALASFRSCPQIPRPLNNRHSEILQHKNESYAATPSLRSTFTRCSNLQRNANVFITGQTPSVNSSNIASCREARGCLAEAPIRFCVTALASNHHFGIGITGSACPGQLRVPICPMPLGVSRFLLSRWLR